MPEAKDWHTRMCGKMPPVIQKFAAIQKMLRPSKKYNVTANAERSYI
jgi:hypothetical protein